MTDKTRNDIEEVIKDTLNAKDFVVKDEDVQALGKAYLKHGDIDLAVNESGEVLSDVMEGEHLDAISNALNSKFGLQAHDIPFQIYPIKINGHTYDTYIDEYDNQRFVGNPIVALIVRNMQSTWNKYFLAQQETDEGYDASDKTDEPIHLSFIAARYAEGDFTFEQYLDFHAALGYSLKMLKRLPEFEIVHIENPGTSSN